VGRICHPGRRLSFAAFEQLLIDRIQRGLVVDEQVDDVVAVSLGELVLRNVSFAVLGQLQETLLELLVVDCFRLGFAGLKDLLARGLNTVPKQVV
jgi:hypothetical protein